jgi:hypothetical protein
LSSLALLSLSSPVCGRLQQLLLIVEDKVYSQDLQRRDFEVDLNHAQQRCVHP